MIPVHKGQGATGREPKDTTRERETIMNCIAAVDENWAIGRDGELLASIPADMKYFREMTLGRTVIMGRKTLESFPGKKALKGRRNIVLSRNPDFTAQGADVVRSVEEAVSAVSETPAEDVFVIGGGSVYRALLPFCDTAYITKIRHSYDADTTFPDLDSDPEWELAEEGGEQFHLGLGYRFCTYRRRNDKVRTCHELIYTSCLSGFPISSSERLAVLRNCCTKKSLL